MGIQVDEDKELAEVRERIKKADIKTFDEGETACCYAKADKTWVIDPGGVAWEAYKTMSDVEFFGKDQKLETQDESKACCAPSQEKPKVSLGEAVAKKKSCC
jgi:lactoylglutathione lyase